jgi:hypothetical protein
LRDKEYCYEEGPFRGDLAPQLTANDRILMFASGRPGSLGQFDIWKCVRPSPDAPFSKPINLGPPVDTPDSEGRPILSDDGQKLSTLTPTAPAAPPPATFGAFAES